MFATAAELATAMRRTFTPEETAWVETLLEEATEYMRSELGGAHIAPTKTSTFQVWPVHGQVEIPLLYIRSIDAVTHAGAAVPYTQFEDTIHVSDYAATPLTVTVTHGLAKVPADLRGICIGMVVGQIHNVESGLGLKVGGLSSIALDDFKVAFSDGGDQTGLYLAEHHISYLHRHYGRMIHVAEVRK